MALCALCKDPDNPVDPDNRLTFHGVFGWELPREQGGLNTLALRKQTGEYAHWACVDRVKHGISATQTSLV